TPLPACRNLAGQRKPVLVIDQRWHMPPKRGLGALNFGDAVATRQVPRHSTPLPEGTMSLSRSIGLITLALAAACGGGNGGGGGPGPPPAPPAQGPPAPG